MTANATGTVVKVLDLGSTAPTNGASFSTGGLLDFNGSTGTSSFAGGTTTSGSTITVTGGSLGTFTATYTGYVTNDGSPVVILSSSEQDSISEGPYAILSSSGAGSGTFKSQAVLCFCAGTAIATPAGDRAVETLRVGDSVTLAAGGTREIVWIGHRKIDVSRHPFAWEILPVRVLAGAFGAGLPTRDLLLSPHHAVFVDGVLIPVQYLINDCTISQERADEISYWHVELAEHDVILAEGLACESYLDTGNRDAFDNADVTALHPRFGLRDRDVWETRACAPLVESGPKLDAVRARLAEIAGPLMPAAEIVAIRTTGVIRAMLPAGVLRVHLVSHCRRPEGETRRLGAAIAGITLDGAAVALDGEAAATGFHAPEQGWRWTHGEGVLLVAPSANARELVVNVAMLAA